MEFLNYQKNKEELEEILLTTNGTQLSKYAEFLFKNDVKRINVSIDSLDPNKFCLITNGGILENVINGIKKSKRFRYKNKNQYSFTKKC
ncbi:MAG: radical SAM protein [Alphaproteobacteria bacterium]